MTATTPSHKIKTKIKAKHKPQTPPNQHYVKPA